MRTITLIFLLFFLPLLAHAKEKELNVLAWSGEIPDILIHQFERQTGIHVNITYFENNEALYAKLKLADQVYDIIQPSNYFVSRMAKEGLLEQLEKSKLSLLHNIDPFFINSSYDPNAQYSIPFLWGTTGIFVNTNYHKTFPTTWKALWEPHYRGQLLLINDVREVFGMALLSLGYSPNTTNPNQIKEAYEYLKQLGANIKLFASDAMTAILLDEDATVGMVWNGEWKKASEENRSLHFILPKEGFLIAVDTLAIPRGAPHKQNAYRFIQFLLQAKHAKTASLLSGYATTNRAAKRLLPPTIKKNPAIYPSKTTLRRGYFLMDIPNETVALYLHYWSLLKLSL